MAFLHLDFILFAELTNLNSKVQGLRIIMEYTKDMGTVEIAIMYIVEERSNGLRKQVQS